jgi:hypothetical protein
MNFTVFSQKVKRFGQRMDGPGGPFGRQAEKSDCTAHTPASAACCAGSHCRAYPACRQKAPQTRMDVGEYAYPHKGRTKL